MIRQPNGKEYRASLPARHPLTYKLWKELNCLYNKNSRNVILLIPKSPWKDGDYLMTHFCEGYTGISLVMTRRTGIPVSRVGCPSESELSTNI